MILKLKNLIFLIFALICLKGFSQENKDYIILTFITEDKGGRHPASTYYWIIKVDSINNLKNPMVVYPTYLNIEYSNDCLIKCCQNKNIDLLTSTTGSNYDYSEAHIKQAELLLKLVNENKKFLQKIRITWPNFKIRRIIKVYGTAINGKFCECNIFGLSLRFADGQKKVFIPYGNHSIIKGFWNTEKGESLKFHDFSEIRSQNTN